MKITLVATALTAGLLTGTIALAQEVVPDPAAAVEEDEAFLAGDEATEEPATEVEETTVPTDEEAAEAPAEESEEPTDEEQVQDEAFLTDTEVAEIEAPEEEKGVGLHEDPDEAFFSVGARARWLMVPEWFITMFGVNTKRPVGAPHLLVSNFGGGPEFTYRKDGFEIVAAVWYAGLNWDESISFKGEGEDGNSWEVIENSLRAILITVDFMWSTEITDWFAITYGAGLGVGIPWGDITQTEASQASDGRDKCRSADIDVDAWCNSNEEEISGKNWDKLPVVPWIEFLLGLRFKPHRHVAIHLDGGFGLGFQFGGRIGYIF